MEMVPSSSSHNSIVPINMPKLSLLLTQEHRQQLQTQFAQLDISATPTANVASKACDSSDGRGIAHGVRGGRGRGRNNGRSNQGPQEDNKYVRSRLPDLWSSRPLCT
ncbi:hypothetical protein H6P81_018962 [Aristolochia fimbriata]|uniref:Uncharacterized protein n=1 Tax=Aristolochia fimbriata TaxID=158543 RepID=A0AAV7E2R4_ARIFI|nr:hypothetical protein H6P81_018962 [Aristolochia fimbriata]